MPYWRTMNLIAYGLNAAIGCSEARGWVDAGQLRRDAAIYRPYVMPETMELDYDVFCPVWNLPRGAAELRQPVVSATPTLLLTGDYDTLAPTGLADRIARTLSAGRVLRFHGYGHDIFAASACARSAAAAFIANPEQASVPACAQTRRQPRFVARHGAS
jgi:alpha-beta hydrolase superfamily lysophospholipase